MSIHQLSSTHNNNLSLTLGLVCGVCVCTDIFIYYLFDLTLLTDDSKDAEHCIQPGFVPFLQHGGDRKNDGEGHTCCHGPIPHSRGKGGQETVLVTTNSFVQNEVVELCPVGLKSYPILIFKLG